MMQWEGADCLQHFPGEGQMAQRGTWSQAIHQGEDPLSSLGTSKLGTLSSLSSWRCPAT